MNTTQKHLSISDISSDILLLKDGGAALVLEVPAVNFGLLSDKEQMGIISAFAQMLNSLSFSVQIVIYSERLNLASYLTLLDKAYQAQTNPLLKKMMTDYRQFIQTTIKNNEVLDKKFFLVIPLFSLELGLYASKVSLEQKIKTVLLPRRDQILRQLNRVGLRATQLSKQKLIKLFYGIYNGESLEKTAGQTLIPQNAVKLDTVAAPQSTLSNTTPSPVSQATPQSTSDMSQVLIATQPSKTHPFVVEELQE